jgi:O-antigen/teichoic acid export membrane protein
MEELEVVYIEEGLIKSIVSDIVTIGLFISMVAVNQLYLGGSWVVELFALVALCIYAIKYGKDKIKRMSPEQAHEFLSELLKARRGEKYNEISS